MTNDPPKVFIDTGGWYSVVSKDDRYHLAGARYYRRLLDEGAILITSDYVLDETLTRLRYDFGSATAAGFWGLLEQALLSGRLTRRSVGGSVWDRALQIFLGYVDQKFSFTDCTSFVLCEDEKVDEVFGYDHHFRLFGFILNPSLP